MPGHSSGHRKRFSRLKSCLFKSPTPKQMNCTHSNGFAPKDGANQPCANASCGASRGQKSSASRAHLNDLPCVSIAVLQARYNRKLRLAAETDARRGALVIAAALLLLGVTAVIQLRKPRPAAPVPAPATEISSGRIGAFSGYQPLPD